MEFDDRPCSAGGPVEAQLPILPFNGLALIGEAPGADEIAAGMPFAGRAGGALDRALAEAGVDRAACLVANPFRHRPEGNRIALFFANDKRRRAEGLRVREDLPRCHGGRAVAGHAEDVDALGRLLDAWRPRAVVAMGNTALWATAGISAGVVKLAGSWVAEAPRPVLATYHPAYVLRQHSREFEKDWAAHFALGLARAQES